MEEKERVKGNMSFLIKTIKGVCYGIFASAVLGGLVLLASDKLQSHYYKMGDLDFSNYAKYSKIGNTWGTVTDAFIWITLCLLALAIVFLVLLFYCSKMSLTITDKRIYGKAAFGRRVDLPLDMVSAVGTSAFKGIAVATSSGKIKFLGISNQEEVHKAITDLLMERQNNPKPTTQIKQEIQQSNADELKKFKELLDSGIITQEEFDAKKKQLLGL